jgi:type IV secretory pathway ATPase VirB11/archaellum biosynthesis ATPase
MPLEYEIKDNVLRINCLNWAIAPSIEDSDAAMAIVIDKLLENKGVTKVILAEARENEYDEKQTEMLREIAEAYDKILNVEKIVSIKNIAIPGYESKFKERFANLQFLVLELLRKDPIGAYVRVNMEINKIQKLIPSASPVEKACHLHYLTHALLPIKRILENTKLIQKVKPRLAEYKTGDRSLYREIFFPNIRPNFMLTRFMLIPPKEGRLVEKYFLPDKTLVEIYKIPGKTRYFYHLAPLEFKLPEEKFILLDEARRYLAAHRPSEAMLAEPEKVRESFFNIGIGLIRDLAATHHLSLSDSEIRELATILARYTAGFGILELLLSDEKIQDIHINSPIGSFPIFIYHQDYEECETNLIPTREDAEAWATRFRLYSGRPLDEANPVLDTELEVPGGRARVCAITRTVSPYGLGFAFRRHRERPWTIPLFIKVKMVDPLYAGLMSFIIDGGRSLLIAGGRSSGKTSMLNALMLEIMRKFRIVVSEDTLELSVPLMQKLGYNIERLKSRSVITRVETELPPDEVLRTALRLGESALIIGEVRSVEGKALFEAMRIGALANVVAGTIHGESAYGVFDRVVHDLGVPPSSFKAVDLIIICNMLRSPDGLHRFRRVTDLIEVRKHWKEDPLAEDGFVPLMEYSAKEDRLKPTETLLYGESEVLNEIAKRVREWRGAWDKVWDNILLRKRIKETLVEFAEKLNRSEILEAEFVIESNEVFHLISEQVMEEVGSLDSKLIYERWFEWLKNRLKLKL